MVVHESNRTSYTQTGRNFEQNDRKYDMTMTERMNAKNYNFILGDKPGEVTKC